MERQREVEKLSTHPDPAVAGMEKDMYVCITC